jgi:YidC/Oxa1 family membrane protein insertase
MDKNQATGLVLIFGILFVYFTFFAPKPSELPDVKKIKTVKVDSNKPKSTESQVALKALEKLGITDSGLVVDTAPVFLENADIKLAISPIGARIKSVELKNYKTWDAKPLLLISDGRFAQNLILPVAGKSLNISQLPYSSEQKSVKIDKDSGSFSFVCNIPGGGKIEQKFTLPAKGYTVKYAVNTVGLQLSEKAQAELSYAFNANQLEKDILQNRTTTCINYFQDVEGFNNLTETSTTEEKAEINNPVKWFSFKQKFFNTGLISNNGFSNLKIKQITNEADTTSVKNMEASFGVPMVNQTLGFKWYFGPNDFRTLKAVTPDYDKNVYLGWPVINLVNRFITVNVFYWLEGVVSNYGIIIIILVLLIKLLLLPLSYKSYISMAKMKVLKPELDEIKARTGDDMQKAQAEQMKLYQQVGINPLSGCIPLLLQMPILLAMFNFFPNAIELRQESFWWAPDLSTYDSIATLPFKLPGYGDHVSLFTILMTASTLVLTWYNNQTSTVAGPMQSMSYIMPVVFMFILNSLPAGLSFYYLVSNVVSIVQQQVIKRFVDEDQLRAKLEANKVKNATKKKSGFAARLEEAMRMAQDAQKEKDKNKKGK